MPTYFTPLRRKIGVVTLVMALVFTVGWIRSLGGEEHFCCHFGKGTYWNFMSDNGSIRWTMADASSESKLVPFHAGWFRKPYDQVTTVIAGIEEMINPNPWEREWCGFGVYETSSPLLVKAWKFPYWSIVIPLTLLSAWLLLSKPRAKKPPA